MGKLRIRRNKGQSLIMATISGFIKITSYWEKEKDDVQLIIEAPDSIKILRAEKLKEEASRQNDDWPFHKYMNQLADKDNEER